MKIAQGKDTASKMLSIPPQSSHRRLLAQDAKRFSLEIMDEGEEFYRVLDPKSQRLIVVSTMADLRKRLDKAGLHEPIKVK
jgi:hypothetical protein